MMLKNIYIDGLLFIIGTPFMVMAEDCIPVWRFPVEEMPLWKKTPQASALEFVKNGIDNLYKVEFGDIPFLLRKDRV